MYQKLLLVCLAFLSATAFAGIKKPLALVYSGPGSCEEGCSEAAAQVAQRTGLEVKYVSPQTLTPSIFAQAMVWIQPGGDAVQVAKALSADQKQALRAFISTGGTYLGFCAGAFLADSTVDNALTVEGLNLIPGTTHDFAAGPGPTILPVTWNQQQRHIFFEDGGYFDLDPTKPAQIIARYVNQAPAAILVNYGSGSVALSFPHPEALEDWKKTIGADPDGSDFDLADGLLRMALHQKITSP